MRTFDVPVLFITSFKRQLEEEELIIKYNVEEIQELNMV